MQPSSRTTRWKKVNRSVSLTNMHEYWVKNSELYACSRVSASLFFTYVLPFKTKTKEKKKNQINVCGVQFVHRAYNNMLYVSSGTRAREH